MDLEELKKQWDGLSEQLKKQQVLNHSLINRAMNTKMDSIMRYNLIGISCCVLYILLAIFAPPTIFSRLVTIYLNIVIPFAGIWQCVSFVLFLKMRHYRNNITTMEHYLIRYEKCEKLRNDLANTPSDVELASVYYHEVIIPDMLSLRSDADLLEQLTDKSYWPYPTYSDLLFY